MIILHKHRFIHFKDRPDCRYQTLMQRYVNV
jgi:hypothetical protein